MVPVVQASIIIAASEWAVQLTKIQTPSRAQYVDNLVNNFRTAYDRVLQVVKEVGATSD